MNNNKEIIKALNYRYAVRIFDPSKKVSTDDLNTILESARLSPSSFGIEAWKFIVVTNQKIRAKIRVAGYDQPKITEASHLVVIARRTDTENLSTELVARTAKSQEKDIKQLDGLKQMLDGAISGKEKGLALDSWIAEQTYIALGIMIETASLLGIDNGPIEGFDPAKVNEILGLKKKNLSVVTMLTLGYRGDDSYSKLPKTRRPFDEVVEFI